MQVMHAREVETLHAEIRTLRAAVERGEDERAAAQGEGGAGEGQASSSYAQGASPSARTHAGGEGGGDEDDDGPAVAWEVAVLGSLGELRRALLTTCHTLADEADELEPSGPLRLAARIQSDVGSRATLARLAADDAADASDELRRLQLTAEAIESYVQRVLRARSHGLARPPRWLLLSWHYMQGCTAAPAGDEPLDRGGRGLGGGLAMAYSTPRQMASRVRAAIQRRRVGRGYDRVPMSM